MSENEGILKRLSNKFSALFKEQTSKQQSKIEDQFKIEIDVKQQQIDSNILQIQEGPPKFERINFPKQKFGKIIPRLWGQLEQHYSLQAKQREYQKMPILQKNYPLVDEPQTIPSKTQDQKSRWDFLQIQNNLTSKCVQTDIEYFDMKLLTKNKQSAQRSCARDQIKTNQNYQKQQNFTKISFPFQDSGSLAPLSKVITSPQQSESIQTNPKTDNQFIALLKQNIQQKEQFSESKQTSVSKLDEVFPIDNPISTPKLNSENLNSFFTPIVKQIPLLDEQKTPGFDANSLKVEQQQQLQQNKPQAQEQQQQQQQKQLLEQEQQQEQQIEIPQLNQDSQIQPLISNPFAQTVQYQLTPPWLSNNQQSQQNNVPMQNLITQPMNNLFQPQLSQQPSNPFQNTLSMQFQEPQQQQYQQIPNNQQNYQHPQIYSQQQYTQQSQLVPEQNMLGGGSFSANQPGQSIFNNNYNPYQQPQQQQSQQSLFQSQKSYQQNQQPSSSQVFPWQNPQPQMANNNISQTQQSQNSNLFAPINPESLFQSTSVANKKVTRHKPSLWLDEPTRIE